MVCGLRLRHVAPLLLEYWKYGFRYYGWRTVVYDLVTKQAFLPRHNHRSVLHCGLRILLVATPLGQIGTDVRVERDPQVPVPVVLDPMEPVLVPGVHGTDQGSPDRLTLADPTVDDGGDARAQRSEQRRPDWGCPRRHEYWCCCGGCRSCVAVVVVVVVVVKSVVVITIIVIIALGISMGIVVHTVDTIFSIQLINQVVVIVIIIRIIIIIILNIGIAFVVGGGVTILYIRMNGTIIRGD